MDYKNTLLLPKTDFPMRAELPKREPALLAKWRQEKIYNQIMDARKDAPQKFVLHDGPPFANGDAHMGHALNMVLKDIVLKYHNMSGPLRAFRPRLGLPRLPIEFKVMKDLGVAETDPIKIARSARPPPVTLSVSKASSSSASASSATGKTPTSPSTPPTRPKPSASSPPSSKRSSSTRASAPSSGAPAARPPSPKPKSSTRKKSTPPSM